MASSFSFKPLRTQLQISSFTHCKHFKFHFSFQSPTFSPTEHALLRSISPVKAKVTANDSAVQLPRTNLRYGENGNGVSSSTSINKRISKNFEKNLVSTIVDEPVEEGRVAHSDRDTNRKKGLVSKNKRETGSVGEKSARKTGRSVSKVDKDNIRERLGKKENGSRKKKVDTLAGSLRVGLDMCSKSGDVMGAIRLYELAKRDGIKLSQYHYAVLLYLCSSAATGIVQPAKSGTGSRSVSPVNISNENSNVAFEDLGEMGEISNRASHRLGANGFPNSNETLDELVESMKKKANSASSSEDDRDEQMGNGIQVSEDVKKLALKKGYEIHEEMCVQNVPMNEATLTSVARMAMSLGDGEMAFDMVKQMKQLGINPRLRSYGPALSVFCSKGDVEKAFEVEKHMLEHGVDPEEPELEALLKASIEAGKSDKVYYLLHKLRTSVRKVSPATADLIELWFKSKVASIVGETKWDKELIIEAIKNGGGGWHGQGWLGKGKWTVSRTLVGSDGLCKSCGERLVTIDLDPLETENFAKSVAAIASQREKHSSFQKFQGWLDYHGPFEAVVDAANIGLYSQRKFKPSKVNAVVNGICQMLPSRKWPLIVLHNRHIAGEKMDEPYNRAIIEKWKDVGALYATPTGSNDDWYWLYAAIKFKCLLVTNDEMRDHLFQLLGNDFFPKWKERHQVHFTFSENGPVFHMPPPYSVVIQESEKGHWHVPIESEVEHEDQRTWLCITRAQSNLSMEQGLAMSPRYVVSEEKRIAAQISKVSNTELIEKVLKEFDEKQKTDFKASCLGHLSELPKSKYSGQLIQFMVNRIIIFRKMNEVWFMVNEKCLRFGMQEFALVTGLNCNDIPTGPEVEKIVNKHRIYDEYFQGTKKISVADLEKKFHGCQIKNDKYKLGLALIVEGVLIAKDRALGISMETLSIVDDLPFFFSYPWGRISYDLLIKSLKRPWATRADMVKINVKDRMAYVLYGFPAALQAWVYEAIPELGSIFAKKIGDVLPRIMRWEGMRQTHLSMYEGYIKNNIVHVWATLRPTEDEQQKHYWTSIKLPSDFADEVFDKIVSEITEIQEAVPLVLAPSGGENRDLTRQKKSEKAPLQRTGQSDEETGNDDTSGGKSMHARTFDVAVIQQLLDSHTRKIEKKIDDAKEEFNQRLDSIENKLKHHVTPSRVDSF